MNPTHPAADGFPVPMYVAKPKGTPKAGVAVFHEAFGVTKHMRDMCDWLAGEGYLAAAPELFARVEPDADKRVLRYNKNDFEAGRAYIRSIPYVKWVEDCAATVAYLKAQGCETVFATGYCWGGSLAYLTACHVPGVAATDSYYGGMIAELVSKYKPKCPTQFHVATQDRYIDMEEAVKAISHHLPQAPLHVYVADHGFNRNGGVTFDAEAASLARTRTLAFFQANLVR